MTSKKPNVGPNESLAQRKKFLYNSIFSAISSASDVLLLVLSIYAGRSLGADNFGIFNTALSVSIIVIFLTNLGLDSLSIRNIAIDTNHAPKLMGEVLIWKLLLCTMIIGISIPALVAFVKNPLLLQATLILCGAAILRSFNLTLRSFLQAYERFDLESTIVLLERFLVFSIGIAALYITNSVVALASVFLIVRIITLLSYSALIRSRICRIKWNFQFDSALKFQLSALPYGIAMMIYGVYMQMDILFLSYFSGNAQVGLFSAAYNLYTGLLVLPLIIVGVMYPRTSKLRNENYTRHLDLVQRTMKYMLLIAFPLLVVGLLFPESIMLSLYGAEYSSASGILTFLLFTTVFSFSNTAIFMVCRSIDKQKYVLRITLLGLASKLLLDLGLIPVFGIKGAVIAVTGSSFIMSLYGMVILYAYNYPMKQYFIVYSKLAFIVTPAILVISHFLSLPMPATLVITGLTYLVLMFLTKILDKFEREMAYHYLVNPFSK